MRESEVTVVLRDAYGSRVLCLPPVVERKRITKEVQLQTE